VSYFRRLVASGRRDAPRDPRTVRPVDRSPIESAASPLGEIDLRVEVSPISEVGPVLGGDKSGEVSNEGQSRSREPTAMPEEGSTHRESLVNGSAGKPSSRQSSFPPHAPLEKISQKGSVVREIGFVSPAFQTSPRASSREPERTVDAPGLTQGMASSPTSGPGERSSASPPTSKEQEQRAKVRTAIREARKWIEQPAVRVESRSVDESPMIVINPKSGERRDFDRQRSAPPPEEAVARATAVPGSLELSIGAIQVVVEEPAPKPTRQGSPQPRGRPAAPSSLGGRSWLHRHFIRW
jgi:hypothetical protein